MAKRVNIADELVASVAEAGAILRGEAEPARFHPAPPDPPVDVRAVRARTGLSQARFAARFGLDAAAVRDWEQGRRRPERAARVLLRVIAHAPEAVAEAVSGGDRGAAR